MVSKIDNIHKKLFVSLSITTFALYYFSDISGDLAAWGPPQFGFFERQNHES